MGAFEELSWRGLVAQATAENMAEVLAKPLAVYSGFDPTAASLHAGNLVPLMLLTHLRRHGHQALPLVGGATGMIGDPSGKTSERTLLDEEKVRANTGKIRAQIERFFAVDDGPPARVVDNLDWLGQVRLLDFLRDVGKHFAVNQMIQRDSVKARFESRESGISYTEFSYMLLQAYDFLELRRRHDVRLQMGGSDQWGNITAGIELIRRVLGADAHAITAPLVTTSTGTKFGKTEAGAVWLDATLTTPYKFYQFWINIEDRDAPKYLRYFTLLDRARIEELDGDLVEHPQHRNAQRTLAREVTKLVHGDKAVSAAEEVSELLFSGADPKALSRDALLALQLEIPVFTVEPKDELTTYDVLEATLVGPDALFASKGDMRRMLQQGGVYLNGHRLGAERLPLTPGDLLGDEFVLVRKGAKSYGLVKLR
jgi:tyrosyl-tRNA synthetase